MRCHVQSKASVPEWGLSDPGAPLPFVELADRGQLNAVPRAVLMQEGAVVPSSSEPGAGSHLPVIFLSSSPPPPGSAGALRGSVAPRLCLPSPGWRLVHTVPSDGDGSGLR